MFNFSKKNKKEPKNLKEILTSFKRIENSFDNISRELENLKEENRFSIKRIGMVRFNPFSEVGGDQSFSVSLLDGENSGIVITSHYTREGNRIYGKPIKNGQSEYALSKEEKEAVEKAKKSNIE